MLADPLDVDLGSLDCLLYLLAVAQILVCCKAFQLQTQTTTGIIQVATSRFRHYFLSSACPPRDPEAAKVRNTFMNLVDLSRAL